MSLYRRHARRTAAFSGSGSLHSKHTEQQITDHSPGQSGQIHASRHASNLAALLYACRCLATCCMHTAPTEGGVCTSWYRPEPTFPSTVRCGALLCCVQAIPQRILWSPRGRGGQQPDVPGEAHARRGQLRRAAGGAVHPQVGHCTACRTCRTCRVLCKTFAWVLQALTYLRAAGCIYAWGYGLSGGHKSCKAVTVHKPKVIFLAHHFSAPVLASCAQHDAGHCTAAGAWSRRCRQHHPLAKSCAGG